MLQPFNALRRADQAAGAAHIDFTFLRHRFAPAFGTVVGKGIGIARIIAGQVFNHLRNYVPGALQHDPVTDAQPQPGNFITIVQRDIGHHHTPHGNRLQSPNRGQLTRPAHLDIDGLQRRLGPLRRKLMRNCPARGLGHEAQALLPVKPIYLIDHAINIIWQVSTLMLNAAIMGEQFTNAITPHQQG